MKPMVQGKFPPQMTAKPNGLGTGAPPVYNPFAPVQRMAAPPVYNPSAHIQRMTAPPAYKPSTSTHGMVSPSVFKCETSLQKAPTLPVYRPQTSDCLQRKIPLASSVNHPVTQSGFSALRSQSQQVVSLYNTPIHGRDTLQRMHALSSTMLKTQINFISSEIGKRQANELDAKIDASRLIDIISFNEYRHSYGLNTLFRNYYTETPLGSMKGLARKEDMCVVRMPRKKNDLQLTAISRLSNVLFAWVKDKVNMEQEIQCMQIGNKLIVTANLSDSVNALKKMFENCKDRVESILLNLTGNNFQSTKMYQPQSSRKLEELLDSPADLEPIFKQVSSDVTVEATVETCPTLLSKPGPNVIFLTPGACHAEQNFLLILAQMPPVSNSAFEAVYIAGKKRPCASCCRTLMLFSKYWYNIGFIPRGGHYFETANAGLDKLIEIGLRQGRFRYEEVIEWLNIEVAQQMSHTSLSRSGKSKLPSEKGDTGFGSETEDEGNGICIVSRKRQRE